MRNARSSKRKPVPRTQKQEDKAPKWVHWRYKMSPWVPRNFDLPGHYEKWTPKELAMIGTMPDREVARLIGRSVSAVRAKKFELREG